MNVLTVQNWEQHFEVMSDEQLDTEIKLKKVRKIQLREENGAVKPEGWRIFAGHLVKLFYDEFAQYIDYKQLDEKMLLSYARTWAIHLETEYVLYGIDGIRAAMRSYVDEDESVYYRFPKVGQIKARCAMLHGSPEHELGIREQRRNEAEIEAEHRRALEEYKVQNPNKWREIQEEARRRYEAQNGRSVTA